MRKNAVHDGNMRNGDTWGGRELPLPLCVSLAPLFFLAPINTFRRLQLWRLHRSKSSLTLLDSLTWAMLRYASLNFSKTNTKLLWQGECLISTVLSNMSFVLLMLLLTVFVSPLSEIAAPNLRSLSKACICHKTITKIARFYQKCFCQTGNFFLWPTLISLWPSLLTLILVYNFKDCKALVCFCHIASLLLCVVFLKWWGNLSSGIIVSYL